MNVKTHHQVGFLDSLAILRKFISSRSFAASVSIGFVE